MRHILIALAIASCSGGAGPRRPVADPRTAAVEIGPGSADLHFVDVDGDGTLDLVSRHLLQDRIVVVFGDGGGGFAVARAVATAIDEPGAMELDDLDRDGAIDLVVATRIGGNAGNEVIEVLRGQRDGTFQPAGAPVVTRAAAETWKPIVALADLDADGALDVISANGRRTTVEVLRGDGRGGLGPARSVAFVPEVGRFYLLPADVDGDGHIDLIASHGTESTPTRIITARGDGTGGFADPIDGAVELPANAALEAVADVDGDHRADAVISDHDRIHVLLGDGTGRFTAALGSPFAVGLPAYDVAVADTDGDSRADLVVATVDTDGNGELSRIVVLRGDGRSFAPAPGSPYTSGAGAFDVATADVDADGRVDLAASSFGGDTVTLVLGGR